MKLNDAVFGLLLTLLGAAVLVAIQGYPRIPGQPVGPALFPGAVAAGLCVAGVLLIVRGLRHRGDALARLGRLGALAAPRAGPAGAARLGVFYIVAAECSASCRPR